jgi:DNA-binding transcriptional MerR regulator
VYGVGVLGILHFVTQARRLGLTLKEIGDIVALRCVKPGPCVHVRALLEQKLADLDSPRRQLRKILSSWQAASARRGVVCQPSKEKEATCHGYDHALYRVRHVP